MDGVVGLEPTTSGSQNQSSTTELYPENVTKVAFLIEECATSLPINSHSLVPKTGLEPVRYCYQWILSPLCLPIPPPGHIYTGFFKPV